MAESTKELRQRITGVSNIQKITRAMEMVATTKLRRLQQRAEGTRPYADTIVRLSARLAGSTPVDASPLTRRKDDVQRAALLVISSDRGLCGSYNAHLFRAIAQHLDGRSKVEPALYVVGKKAVSHYHRRLPIRHVFEDLVEQLDHRRVKDMLRLLTERFLAGGAVEDGVDEVWVASTRFVSMARQVPVIEKLLPIESVEEEAGSGGTQDDVILEPSPEDLILRLLPKALEVRLLAAVFDSLTSEFAARRMAMKAATDAAGDMIQDLRRRYNRARQEAITKELLDIIGGAEAQQ